MTNSLRESYSRAVARTESLPVRPDILFAEEAGNNIRITCTDPRSILKRIENNNVLFLEIRRMVRMLKNDMAWCVKYASQIEEQFPFLHHAASTSILIDVMLPYRNPIQSLSKDQPILLTHMPSNAYYFKR